MKLVIISDTHNQHNNLIIPHGDALIHCGDFSNIGKHEETFKFLEWFSKRPHKYKIFISGNHDFLAQKENELFKSFLEGFPDLIYLQDSVIEIEGYFFYGSPWVTKFFDWAFMAERGSSFLKAKRQAIPEETDVLITHGPPKGIGDWNGREHVGCELLADRIEQVQPLVHCFGHIHHSYGMYAKGHRTLYCNAATCTEGYKPKNRPLEIII